MNVTLYTKRSAKSEKAKEFLNENGVSYEEVKLNLRKNEISEEHIKLMLQLSFRGFEDFVLKTHLKKILELTTRECIEYIKRHPEVLKMPIAVKNNVFVVGFSEDEYSVFIDKKQRKKMLREYLRKAV